MTAVDVGMSHLRENPFDFLLSRSDRESGAEEGAASATRVKSGLRLWELEDIARNL